MAFVEKIKTYSVMYYAGGKNTTGNQYRAVIALYRDDYSLIGSAHFHRDADTMPSTDNQTSTGYVWLHYTWEDFPQIIDLLRNESPIFVRYVAGDWKLGSITTSLEPIGEGEVP